MNSLRIAREFVDYVWECSWWRGVVMQYLAGPRTIRRSEILPTLQDSAVVGSVTSPKSGCFSK